MAFELHRVAPLPGKAASACNVGAVLTLDTGDTQRQFVPVATLNAEPIGVAQASVVNPGDAVTVYDHGHIVRAAAAASLGAGADIGVVGATNSLGLVAGASGVVKWAVGKSLTAAAAGETFSLLIRPRQLNGLA